jgi:hypothetical protein
VKEICEDIDRPLLRCPPPPKLENGETSNVDAVVFVCWLSASTARRSLPI